MLLPIKLSLLLLVTACGFKPLHSTHMHMSDVQIMPIADHTGMQLHDHLSRKLRDAADADYQLVVTLRETSSFLGIQDDASSSYAKLRLIADYVIIQKETGEKVLETQAVSHFGYSVLPDEYDSIAAKDNARQKALVALSETIAQRVVVFLAK